MANEIWQQGVISSTGKSLHEVMAGILLIFGTDESWDTVCFSDTGEWM